MSGKMSGLGFYERGLLLKKVQVFDMALKEFQQATTDPQQAGKAFAQVGSASEQWDVRTKRSRPSARR